MPKTPSRNATQQPARTNSPREVRSFGSSKRPHPHAKQLVAVPVEAVAAIAATLSREGITPSVAVARAYELLDLAVLARSYLEIGRHYHEALDFHQAREERGKNLPPNIAPRDDDGAPLAVPFAQAMIALMPDLRADEAMTRFRRWLQATEGLTFIEAGEQIAAMKREGIAPNLYQLARMSLAAWFERSKKEVRSFAGRKGAQARTANKGKKKK